MSDLVNRRWRRTADRAAATQAARQAFWAKFLREADPTGTLDFETRLAKVEELAEQYFRRLGAQRGAALAARKRAKERKTGYGLTTVPVKGDARASDPHSEV